MAVLYYTTLIVGVLISVSFYTLYERKILGLSHIRTGPKVVGVSGLLQPFADAVKLFVKEQVAPLSSNYSIYVICPLGLLVASLMAWSVVPVKTLLFNFKWLVVLFFLLTAISVYCHLGSGWASNSNYAMIGGLRCVAQSLSYEVSLAFLFMGVMMLINKVDLIEIARGQEYSPLGVLIPPLMISWWSSSVAETNRSPFDFAEGESELVSGFNVEYGSGYFAFMFIAEYSSMIFMSLMIVVLFVSGETSGFVVWGSVGGSMYLFVWLRVSYPRTRYDKLMTMSWLIILPFSLVALGSLLIV